MSTEVLVGSSAEKICHSKIECASKPETTPIPQRKDYTFTGWSFPVEE